MREFQQKKQLRRAIYSKLTLFLLLIAFIVIAKAAWNVYGKERESADKTEQAQNQLSSLSQRQAALSEDISRLETDLGVEEKIRDDFRMAKEGEKLVIFLDTKTPASVDSTQSTLRQVWQKMKGLFGQ